MCEQLDVAAAQGIEARMIGNQPDVLAAERRKLFCFENVEPRLHPNGVAGAFAFGGRPRGESGRCKQSNEQSEWSECSERAFRGGQMVPLSPENTMIFWNTLTAAALRAQDACAMNKCRLRAARGDCN